MRPPRLYKVVISWITTNALTRPFAVWELAESVQASRPAIRTVLNQLQVTKLLVKNTKAFACRYWSTTPRWKDENEVIKTYEFFGMKERTEVENGVR